MFVTADTDTGMSNYLFAKGNKVFCAKRESTTYGELQRDEKLDSLRGQAEGFFS